MKLTHPDIASLVDPLFSFAGKRVEEMFSLVFDLFIFSPLSILKFPLSAAGEERVVHPPAGGDGRVSKIADVFKLNQQP
jgi:hypothetical protein